MENKKMVIFISVVVFLIIFGIVFIIINGNDDAPKTGEDSFSETYTYEEEGTVDSQATLLSEAALEDYQQDIDTNIMYFDYIFSDQYPIKDFNKLSAKDKTLLLVATKLDIENREIGVAELERIKDNYFEDFDLTLKDLKVDDRVIYKYENGSFTYNGAIGGACLATGKEIAENAYHEYWAIEKKVYFMSQEIENNGSIQGKIYKNLKDCEKKKNVVFSFPYDGGGFTEKDFESIKSKLNTYVYKFKKIGNEYFIESIDLK